MGPGHAPGPGPMEIRNPAGKHNQTVLCNSNRGTAPSSSPNTPTSFFDAQQCPRRLLGARTAPRRWLVIFFFGSEYALEHQT